jgi:signal transduction histidine kinase
MARLANDRVDAWFAASPLPMFETQLNSLGGVLRAVRRRIGRTDKVELLTAEEIEAIRAAHLDSVLIRANPALHAFFQVAPENLLARWPALNESALNGACDATHLSQLISGQTSVHWTAEWTLPDGALRAAKVVSSLLRQEEGDVFTVANTLMDITEHRRDARLLFEDNPTPTVEVDMTEVALRIVKAVSAGLKGSAFRAALDEAHDHMRFLRANAAAERLLQRTNADLAQDYNAILFRPDLRRAAVDAMQESLEKQVLQRPFMAPILRPDGSARHVLIRTRAIGPGGAPWARTQITLTDVTTTRVAEIKAQASMASARVEAERQRARWERSAALVNAACYELNIKERAYLPSASMEALLGVSVEALNATGSMFLPMVPEPWKSELRARYLASVASGEPLRFEHPLDRPDGQRIWLESNFVVDAEEDDERLTGYGYLQDITARKALEEQALAAVARAEAALTVKRQMLAAFLDEACDAPATTAVDQGGDLAGLLARQLSVLREIDDRDKMLTRVMMVLDESRLRAEAANVAKSQFLAVMSHELRTPLNAVIGYSEILEDEWSGRDASATKDLGRIKGAARHLLALITEILDFAKIDAGKMELALEKTDIASVLINAADLVRPMAEAKGLAFHIDLAPDLGASWIDAKRFKQCVVNLLSNAQKFTAAGGVSLTARRLPPTDGDALEVVVRDTGCGIAPEHIAHLFEPFRQVDASMSRRHEGAGLGLAITRKLARLMGGDLRVQSALDAGSTFTLTVRAEAAAPDVAAAA